MHVRIFLLTFFILVFMSPEGIIAGKREYKLKLTKYHVTKIERIVNIITNELNKRSIRELDIKDFTDIKGRDLKIGKEIADKFREIMAKKGFTINKNASTIISGKMINYKDAPKRWKVDIRVESKESKIITSYSAIFNF